MGTERTRTIHRKDYTPPAWLADRIELEFDLDPERTLVTATTVVAGDIAAVARLTRAETGDTLSSIDAPRVLKPWSLPEPLLPVAVQARSKADEDKLSQALGRLAAEDPSLRIENNAETHQLVLWCMGEAHAQVLLERLSERYGVNVDEVPVVVPLRETFGGSGKGKGRHVKQSGGHGQQQAASRNGRERRHGENSFQDRMVRVHSEAESFLFLPERRVKTPLI